MGQRNHMIRVKFLGNNPITKAESHLKFIGGSHTSLKILPRFSKVIGVGKTKPKIYWE